MPSTFLLRITIILCASVLLAGAQWATRKPIVLRTERQEAVLPPTTSSAANIEAGSERDSEMTADPKAITAAMIDEWNRNGEAAIVDARLAEEFAEGRIPYAYNLPFGDFLGGRPAVLDELDPAQLTIIYCGGGDCDASHKVERMLIEYGFTNVVVYLPGWPGWLEYGGEVEK